MVVNSGCSNVAMGARGMADARRMAELAGSKLGIAYRSIDVDSVEYQKDDLGGKIRAVLADRTGQKTMPQIFVGAEHIGGCTDLFDAWRNGSLQKRLDEAGVSYDRDVKLDPYSLLPKWLQPRKTA